MVDVIYFAALMLPVLVHFKGILFAFDLSSVRCSCMAELSETQYRYSSQDGRVAGTSLFEGYTPLKLFRNYFHRKLFYSDN